MKAYFSLIGALCPEIKQSTHTSIGIYKSAITIFLISFCFVFAAKAQESEVNSPPVAKAETKTAKSEVAPLSVGDQVPDELWNLQFQVTNHPGGKKTVSLNEYQGKLIILDFWSTWCGACLESFPYLDSLQKQFGNQIEIFLINPFESEDVIRSRLSKSSNSKKLPNLNRINDSKVFKKYFTFNGVPHHIWIGRDRLIKASTGGYNTSERNIKNYLIKGEVDITNKMITTYFNEGDLLSTEMAKNALQYSIVTRNLESYKSSVSAKTDGAGNVLLNAVNQSILDLYRFAYGRKKMNNIFRFDNKVKLSAKDNIKYYPPNEKDQYDKWRAEHTYTYRSFLHEKEQGEGFTKMQKDLDQYFGLTSEVERLLTPSLILVKNPYSNILETKGQKFFSSDTNIGLELGNQPFSVLVKALTLALSKSDKPFVDKTGLQGNIDISLHCPLDNVILLKKELRKYGLDLVDQSEWIDMLIIKDPLF